MHVFNLSPFFSCGKFSSLTNDSPFAKLRQMKLNLPKKIRAMFAKAGSKGGKSKSDAKIAACKKNALKPRPNRKTKKTILAV